MNTTLLRVVSAGLFFPFIFLFGFWLSKAGKPYGAVIFNLHKLIALAAVVYLVVTVNRIHQAAPLDPVEIAALSITALLFVVTIIAGGLLSVDRTMPAAVAMLHKTLPYLTALSSIGTLYFLLIHRQP